MEKSTEFPLSSLPASGNCAIFGQNASHFRRTREFSPVILLVSLITLGGSITNSRPLSVPLARRSTYFTAAVKTSSITRFVRQPADGRSLLRLSVQIGWDTPL